jgi:hypothetical protein
VAFSGRQRLRGEREGAPGGCDFEDIVRRSRRTGRALLALQPLLDKDSGDLLTLRARAGQAATAMLSDLETWRVAVESRYLSAA